MIIIRLLIIALIALTGAHAAPFESYDTAKSWFKDNRSELDNIIDILAEHPNIKSVGNKRLEIAVHFQFSDFNKSDLSSFKKLRSMADQLGIISIMVSRVGGTKDGKLISIDLLLISKGNVLGGYSKSASYVTDPDFLEKAKSHGFMYTPLDNGNWYLSEKSDN